MSGPSRCCVSLVILCFLTGGCGQILSIRVERIMTVNEETVKKTGYTSVRTQSVMPIRVSIAEMCGLTQAAVGEISKYCTSDALKQVGEFWIGFRVAAINVMSPVMRAIICG